LDEWNILDDDFVIDLVLSFWVKDFVGGKGIIKNSSLGDLLGLEAFVLLEVLSIVISQMVVRNNRLNFDSRANEEVTHDGLESSLSTLEVRSSDKTVLLLGIVDNSFMEGVLWRSVQIKNLLFDSSHAEDN